MSTTVINEIQDTWLCKYKVHTNSTVLITVEYHHELIKLGMGTKFEFSHV